MKRLTFLILILSQALFGVEKPYVIGHLMGQLGNQMFIIAAATSLALDHDAEAFFPGLATETDFNIPINYKKVFSHLNATQPDQSISLYYREKNFFYEPIQYQPNMLIFGWFQSEKYFLNHKKEVIDLFAPSKEILTYLSKKYKNILDHPNTVAIHYRSYKKEDPENKVYAKCDLDYYQKAISLFSEDAQFVVFSNDMEWCKPHFPSHYIFIEDEPHYHDLYLMSLCKHNIICNSSFSWWGAYLNLNPSKLVVAPKEWFNPGYGADDRDLIPPEWIRL